MPRSSFIPKQLFRLCYFVVKKSHKDFGYSNLPAKIVKGENMVILAAIGDSFTFMQCTRSFFTLRKMCFIIFFVTILLSWIFTWWLLILLPLVAIVERYFAYKERNYFMLLSAFLLSYEILINDFAGWGTAYPEEKIKTKELFELNFRDKTIWLDYYLPRRNELNDETLKQFGPQ